MLNRARRAKAIAMGAVNEATSHSTKKQDAIPDVIYCVMYKEPPNKSTTKKTNEVSKTTSNNNTSLSSTLDVSYKSEGKLLALELMQQM